MNNLIQYKSETKYSSVFRQIPIKKFSLIKKELYKTLELVNDCSVVNSKFRIVYRGKREKFESWTRKENASKFDVYFNSKFDLNFSRKFEKKILDKQVEKFVNLVCTNTNIVDII